MPYLYPCAATYYYSNIVEYSSGVLPILRERKRELENYLALRELALTAHACWDENIKIELHVTHSPVTLLHHHWSITCFIFAVWAYLCHRPVRCSTHRKEMLYWMSEWVQTYLKINFSVKVSSNPSMSGLLISWFIIHPSIHSFNRCVLSVTFFLCVLEAFDRQISWLITVCNHMSLLFSAL